MSTGDEWCTYDEFATTAAESRLPLSKKANQSDAAQDLVRDEPEPIPDDDGQVKHRKMGRTGQEHLQHQEYDNNNSRIVENWLDAVIEPEGQEIMCEEVKQRGQEAADQDEHYKKIEVWLMRPPVDHSPEVSVPPCPIQTKPQCRYGRNHGKGSSACSASCYL